MKRILILVTVVLIGVAPTAWGRLHSYCTTLGGIKYSPYAFGFGHNGLIPDTLQYSPYAGGLISEFFDYSPYAFDAHHNGLISNVADFYAPARDWVYAQDTAVRLQLIDAMGELTQAIRQSRGSWARASGSNTGQARYARSSRRITAPIKRHNPELCGLVRRHLQATIPGQFLITHLLRIDNDVISFDVVLKNNDTVVKVWNPEKIESLRAHAGRRQKLLDRYLQSWARFGNEYEMKGGTIYHLSSNDSEQVIAKLTTFSELKPDTWLAKR